jgi:hypothetical protein
VGFQGASGVSIIVGYLPQGYIVIVGIIGGYCIPGIWIVIFPSSVVSLCIAW